jgi:hypothetical protein
MFALLLFSVVTAPFPLPTVDGKALAVAPGQTRFLVPMRFEKVREFYSAQLDDPKVTRSVAREKDGQVLTLVSHRADDSWQKAVIRESAFGTRIDVTPLIRLSEEQVTGNGKPLVEFILGRSREVDRAVENIGDSHLERIRKEQP